MMFRIFAFVPRARWMLPSHSSTAIGPRNALGVARSQRHARKYLQNCRVQSEASAHSEVFGALRTDAAPPAQSLAAEGDERLAADLFSTGFTIGPHPMEYHRVAMNEAGVVCAADLKDVPDGTFVRIAGAAIARQRPGTASGFIFIGHEDESRHLKRHHSSKGVRAKQNDGDAQQVPVGRRSAPESRRCYLGEASSVQVLELGPIDMRSYDFH
jgi:hypothetical protein